MIFGLLISILTAFTIEQKIRNQIINSTNIELVTAHPSIDHNLRKDVVGIAIKEVNKELYTYFAVYFLGIMMISHYLSYRFLKPIKIMEKNVKEAMENKEDVTIPVVKSYKELTLLTNVFNELVQKVEENKIQAEYLEKTLKLKRVIPVIDPSAASENSI